MLLRNCFLLLFALSLAACGGKSGEPSALDRLGQARDAMSAATQMAKEAQRMTEQQEAGITYEPVDFRRLRDLLPDQLAGLPREEINGEKSGAMGIAISKASATYRAAQNESGEQPSVEVTLTDLGAVRGFAMMGLVAWRMAEVDRETSTGFERTSDFRGHPGYEKYDTEYGQQAELQVLIADRFLFQAEGQGMDMNRLKQALDGINVRTLEGMREEGKKRVESLEPAD